MYVDLGTSDPDGRISYLGRIGIVSGSLVVSNDHMKYWTERFFVPDLEDPKLNRIDPIASPEKWLRMLLLVPLGRFTKVEASEGDFSGPLHDWISNSSNLPAPPEGSWIKREEG